MTRTTDLAEQEGPKPSTGDDFGPLPITELIGDAMATQKVRLIVMHDDSSNFCVLFFNSLCDVFIVTVFFCFEFLI